MKFEDLKEIQKNDSIMFKDLSGSKLGIWAAHGEGKFKLPYKETNYNLTVISLFLDGF